MIKKVFLILLFSTIILGAVSAADQSSFKAPDDFEDIGDGVYVLYDSSKNADEILSVVKFNQHDWDDYITNDTENQYTVLKDENNTYNYTDGSVNEIGSFELVEYDGDKFIIDFAKTGSDNDLSYTYGNLMDFNKLNNITPIEK
ncbi:MAG: hypothetical protein IJ258_10015 [Methanobrevibacter sp.]|uniref:hypothetical protein n=1 Tax=Methanobrevibacter sp. TaxID=66852 RepID=UPI0025DFA010|nr:hypothetical protein [Methanobrevibacter sp.]MBQ8018421.1 hypothetical protein [Methanobrevibacter sp.]